MKKEIKHIIYIDILKIIACISVIFVHMNSSINDYQPTSGWVLSLFIHTLSYWGVPIFLMITGATLLDYKKKYDIKTYYKRRVSKVVIPWIIWSAIIYVIKYQNLNFINFIKEFLYMNIEGSYWFFPLIIYIYCIIPIFQALIKLKELRIIKYILLILIIFNSVLLPFFSVFNIIVPPIFTFFMHNKYVIYPLLGYLISITDISKNKRYIIYIIGFISLTIRFLYTYITSYKDNLLNTDVSDYTSIFILLIVSSIFVLVKYIKWEKIFNNDLSREIIKHISNCSFGIYLVHKIIIYYINDIIQSDINSIYYKIIGALYIYVLSLLIVTLLKKIPILKKIVP